MKTLTKRKDQLLKDFEKKLPAGLTGPQKAEILEMTDSLLDKWLYEGQLIERGYERTDDWK